MVLLLCIRGECRLNSGDNSSRNGQLDEVVQLRIKALFQSITKLLESVEKNSWKSLTKICRQLLLDYILSYFQLPYELSIVFRIQLSIQL